MKNKLHKPPQFRNPIILQLYDTPYHTQPDCFEELLSLPGAELIADLELLLRHETDILWDTEMKFDEEVDEHGDAIFHSMLLLGHLKSEESLSVLLDVFRVPGDNSYAWLGDPMSEDLWLAPLLCGLNQVEILVEFIQDINVSDEYSKIAIFDSLEQMALHFPEKRTEISGHIYDLLKFFNELSDEEFGEHDVFLLLSSMADAVANLSITRALPIVKALFKKDRIDTMLNGGWNEFKKEIDEEPDTQLVVYEDIREWYKVRGDVWKKMKENERLLGIQMEKESAKIAQERERMAALKVLQEKQLQLTGSTKIGRNDPCPCGSGKKFKRCHGD